MSDLYTGVVGLVFPFNNPLRQTALFFLFFQISKAILIGPSNSAKPGFDYNSAWLGECIFHDIMSLFIINEINFMLSIVVSYELVV